jgi:chromosomal replication initiation ATPase DnaA
MVEERKILVDEAFKIFNQQFNSIVQNFERNIEKAFELKIKTDLSIAEVFTQFRLTLPELISIATKIDPDCLSPKSRPRQKHYVIPRQMICYFAGHMHYTEEGIAKYIGKDRSTVCYSKKTVDNALTFNDKEYKNIYELFLSYMKEYPGGEIINSLRKI